MKKIVRKDVMNTLKIIKESRLTVVHTPAGFGKTTAVKQFFRKYNYKHLWLDLGKDEQMIQSLSDIDEQVSIQFLVLDHVERQHFQEIYDVFQKNPSIHILLISSDMIYTAVRKINVEEVQWIRTDVFKQSINDLKRLVKLNRIPMDEDDISKTMQYTRGWIRAIEVISRDYRIFNKVKVTNHLKDIIQQDLFDKLDISIRYALCFLSEFSEFHVDILLHFRNRADILKLLSKLSSIDWLVDYHEERNAYSLQIPFRAFLADKIVEYGLDLKEFHLYYAKNYEKTRNYLEAIRFYDKAGRYKKIVYLIEQHYVSNFVDYDAELMKKIYDNIPYTLLKKHPYVFLHKIDDHLSGFHDIIHGTELLEQFVKLLDSGYYKDDTPVYQGEVYLIKGFASFNDLEEMCRYFNQAYQLLAPKVSRIANNKMIVTYGCPNLVFLYHFQPGGMRTIVDQLNRHIQNYYEITNFSCAGMAQEAQAEYLLERGEFEESEVMALEAYYKAKDFSQSCIATASLMTIGRAALAGCKQGMFFYAINSLRAERQSASVGLLKGEIDCALAYLYALNNDLKQIPKWLLEGQKLYLLSEANSYVYVVYGLILIKQKQYFHLKVVADILFKVHVYRKHLFGDIYALLYKTIAFHNLGDKEQAYARFQELVLIAEHDGIIMPLIELSDYIRPYIMMNKESDYIKRLKIKIKEKQHGWRTSVFSDRELEVIQYINSGYTRRKTAELMNIKESSLSTYMKRIYKKANVTNKDDLKRLCNHIKLL